MHERYCIFRTDAIGDLILTLPMAFAIKEARPNAQVTFCVQEYTRALAALCPAVDATLEVPGRDIERALMPFVRKLRAERFTTAVFAYPRPILALAAKLAGIPVRIGTAYRFYSFLFTHKHAEHRRESIRHESEYNLNLLSLTGMTQAGAFGAAMPQLPLLHIPEYVQLETDELLHTLGIGEEPYIILHPGSAGSAKDWPAASFGDAAALFSEEFPSYRILITGTPKERPVMEETLRQAGERAVMLSAPVRLDLLASVIGRARLLVANSTGPLHIAAALQVPVVGLYPDDPVLHPRRWGPLGIGHRILTPQSVTGEQSPEALSMQRIRPEDVYSAMHSIVLGT